MTESEATISVAAPATRSPRAPLQAATRRARPLPWRTLHAMARTLRPRQWIKNLLVIAAAGAAGAMGHDDVPVRVSLTFIAFCLLASGIYAINDVRDAEEDRLHPRKRFRPVAAGELDPGLATALGITLMVLGLAICAAVRPLLGAVGAGYVLLTLSYTLVWRHLLVLDIVAIAGGFVLRAAAGGLAAPVTLSRWFVLVVTGAAVFAAAGKRQAELRRTDAAAGPAGAAVFAAAPPTPVQIPARRRVLEGYTAARLRFILIASAVVTIVAYCMWAFALPTTHGIPWRPLTVVPVAACLLRYGALIRKGAGEAPEELLLRDRPLQVAALLWLVLFALEVHAAA